MEQVESLTGRRIKILAGDRGYQGKKKLTVQKSSHLGRHGRLYLTQRAQTHDYREDLCQKTNIAVKALNVPFSTVFATIFAQSSDFTC